MIPDPEGLMEQVAGVRMEEGHGGRLISWHIFGMRIGQRLGAQERDNSREVGRS